MIVSSYLESFICLYHYFPYKRAEGLAGTKQTKDTLKTQQIPFKKEQRTFPVF